MSDPHQDSQPVEGSLRAHVFDGIAEYNRRLPNWWLLTFYGAIVFSVCYWFYYAQSGIAPSDGARVEQELARIEASKMSSSIAIDDGNLWKMSRNAIFVEAGKSTFKSTCASCHNEKLTGGIGPNLVDATWIHGGKPTDVYHTVEQGVLAKGMPAWGPVLGNKKVTEVVAYILSHHQEGEPAQIASAGSP